MGVAAKLAVLAAIFVVSGEALFAPKCLWGGLLGSSEESGERWLRDTSSLSLRTRDSRVRRFLWTDKDVCDWMCRDDYGSEVRDICRRCCPSSPAASTRPRPQTAATASAASSDLQSRAPRTTTAGLTTAAASAGTTAGAPDASSTSAATSASPAASSPATAAPATAAPTPASGK